MIPHDLSGLRTTPGQPPHWASMIPWSWISITTTNPCSACPPSSPNCQFLLRLLLVSRMPWTVLRPSFRSCQVEPTTCTSCCTLPNSHLRAGCQCLRCWILRQPLFSSAYPLTSFPAWPRQSIVQPMFINNLRCRFSFDEPTAAQICAADLSHCWHGCQHL